MIRIVICGALGAMGRALASAVSAGDCLTLVGGIDAVSSDSPFPVVTDPTEMPDCDVVIDFSVPAATRRVLKACVEKKIPIVIGTTGLDEALMDEIDRAAACIPILQSGNLSLGVNLQCALVREAERMLGNGFDVEIIETHHNRKVDAPSGTALMLADSVAGIMQEPPQAYKLGRSEKGRRRERNEIGIHAVRGGSVVGEHQVLFIGENEEIMITHRAFSRSIFADGAVRAALFLAHQPAGRYRMSDCIDDGMK